MAITKIHAIKSTLGKALAYIENPDKTDGQMLVSGYNCEPQTASIDFEMTAVLAHKARNLKRKRSTNLAYHLIQSFSPEDAVTPEQAHELGKKLAFEYTGGKYEYVVATHIDKGHIHNHIMINAVSFYDYKKLRTVPYRTARQIRDISDRLCMEAHLSVIDDPQKIGQLYPENAGKKKSVSNRTEIRKRLNFCLERATDYSQFLSMAKGLEITPTIRGKHISYLLEGAGQSVRDNSLSDTDTFTYAGICARLSDNQHEGITIDQIHVQNEPVANQKFPSCMWTGAELKEFIRDYLGPTFKKNGLDTEIWLGTINAPGCDYNRLIFDKWATEDYDYFANTVLEDDEARQYITGVSYQWGGKIAIQRTFESWWPELRLMQSENECGFGDNTWEYATYVWTMLKHYIGNGAESYMYWNLILAPWGVSTWGDPQNAMVTVQNGDYTLNPDFYVMKHFSNAVQRGAVRLGAAGHWAADALIFRNPDGSYAVEAFNPFREEKCLTVELEGEVTSFMLAPRSFNSMIITV